MAAAQSLLHSALLGHLGGRLLGAGAGPGLLALALDALLLRGDLLLEARESRGLLGRLLGRLVLLALGVVVGARPLAAGAGGLALGELLFPRGLALGLLLGALALGLLLLGGQRRGLLGLEGAGAGADLRLQVLANLVNVGVVAAL